MRRRKFITLLGGAAAWPLAARAQQPAMPVIGFLRSRSPDAYADRLRAFRQGLKDMGYVEGENVAIEYRWAENKVDRLPELAADLVRRRVAVITAAGGLAAAVAAKGATTTIPIVFGAPEDPVRLGLVTSLARPGGNLTGFNILTGELAAKRLELLRELVPSATRLAVLVNPADASSVEGMLREVDAAARAVGLQTRVVNASTGGEIDDGLCKLRARAAGCAFRHAPNRFSPVGAFNWPYWQRAIRSPPYMASREIVAVGGLMSYGSNLTDGCRQVGVYTGRILKGAKPADLPVVQSTQVRARDQRRRPRGRSASTVPPTLLARADEVIE